MSSFFGKQIIRRARVPLVILLRGCWGSWYFWGAHRVHDVKLDADAVQVAPYERRWLENRLARTKYQNLCKTVRAIHADVITGIILLTRFRHDNLKDLELLLTPGIPQRPRRIPQKDTPIQEYTRRREDETVMQLNTSWRHPAYLDWRCWPSSEDVVDLGRRAIACYRCR